VVGYGLNAEQFDPSHLLGHDYYAPLRLLKQLYQDLVSNEGGWSGTELLDRTVAKLEMENQNCLPDALSSITIDKWDRLSGYLNSLYHYADEDVEKRATKTLVVGSGPIGLFHALEAHSRGSAVRIMEKRSNFTRNMWFDLGPSSWYGTLAHTKALGFGFLDLEVVEPASTDQTTPSTDSIILRCQVLQRLLAKTSSIVGIELHFDRAFHSLVSESVDGKLVAAFKSLDGAIEDKITFDLMIAADGAQSSIRNHLGLTYLRQDRFFIDKRIPIDIQGLSQPTILVNLRPDANGACPKLKVSPRDSLVLESLEAGMSIPGVTHTFRRFYYTHCHLQVLLTANNKLVQVESAETAKFEIPWPLLFNLTSILLENPYDNIDHLKANIVEIESPGEAKRFDVEFFRIEIRKISSSIVQPHPSTSPSLVLFIGDASITAHYRMGVGINNGVRQLEMTRNVVDRFPLSKSDIEALNSQEMAQLDMLALFETWLIGSEAYCDYVIGLETSKPRYSFSTWLRDRQAYQEDKDYLIPINGMEILANCEMLAG
jgi:hypothetical protein